MGFSHRKYTVNSEYFKEINTNAKAYFLGLMISDGCNKRTGLPIRRCK